MEDILNKAELSELLQRFIAEKVEPETITAATDMDFIRLGVAIIGDRVRLRETCRKGKMSLIELTLMQETGKGAYYFSQEYQGHIDG